MPTPFTHLRIAQHLLDDEALPQTVRQMLAASMPDYLLGSIIADARVHPGADRELTHFYRYDKPMLDHPWRLMLTDNPVLTQPQSAAHRAFVAGYVAHLAADEYWSKHMLKPHFAESDWGENMRWRFFVLHLLLIHMDERDEEGLPTGISETLRKSQPKADWLPFMPHDVVTEWRDFIAEQIEGESQTLEIFGKRIMRTPDELREMVDSDITMQTYLWKHIPPELLNSIENELYAFARSQMQIYLDETT